MQQVTTKNIKASNLIKLLTSSQPMISKKSSRRKGVNLPCIKKGFWFPQKINGLFVKQCLVHRLLVATRLNKGMGNQILGLLVAKRSKSSITIKMLIRFCLNIAKISFHMYSRFNLYGPKDTNLFKEKMSKIISIHGLFDHEKLDT